MIWVLLSMLGIIVLALLVTAYVAFPRRGADVPALPWVGSALSRAVHALPTLRDPRSSQVH